jgi:acetylornithine/succinyldiaminopimelate/putrescine aminotransferase
MSETSVFTESPYLFNTYRRQPVTFVRGKGPWLWDDKKKRYLDFFSGLAVCNLGHANRNVARAVSHQVRTLLHTSNLFSTLPQRALAKELSTRTFGGKVFFTNSGAEANEGALKLARRFGFDHPGPDGPRHEVIVFDAAFHGRTFGALSATPQKKYQEGFGPLLPGFSRGDLRGHGVRQSKTHGHEPAPFWWNPFKGKAACERCLPLFLKNSPTFAGNKNLSVDVRRSPNRNGTNRNAVCLPKF